MHIPQPPPERGEPPRIHNNYNDYVNMGDRDYSGEAFYNRDPNFRPPPKQDIDGPMMSKEEVLYWHNYLKPLPHDSTEQKIWKKRFFNHMMAIQNCKIERQRARQRDDELEKTFLKAVADFKINKLNNPEMHKFKMKSTQEEQLGIIKEKCDTDRTVADTNHMMLTMIKKLAADKPMDPSFQQMFTIATEKVNQQTKEAYEKKAALEGTRVMAHVYEHRLERPLITTDPYYDAATLKRLEPRNVLQAIKAFNPENNQNNVDFSDTWRHILTYTQKMRLTEQTYIEILQMVLQGPAHKIIYDMARDNASLNDILDILSNLYVKKKTILDDIREVNTFKRRAGEPIITAMSRARILVEKVKHMYSTYSWAENCERLQISILKQIITPATRKHIDLEETNKLRLGLLPDYLSLLQMVDTYEAAHDEIPKTEILTTVGACSGVPSLPPDMVSSPSEIINTKIQNLESMVLNAIDTRDRRSVKERTKSRSKDRASSSRERSRKDLFERQMKQYAKTEESEQKSKSGKDDKSAQSYAQTGYDRKRSLKDKYNKNKKDQKTIDKYVSRSASRESEKMDTSSPKRYRSQSSHRSTSSYKRPRSSSVRSTSRSSTRSTQNYHEKQRSRSSDRNQKKNDYRNKSPHPKKNYNKNYDKYSPRKSYNKKEIYENYPKLKNKRHGPNGELTGFTIENHYYIQCTRPSCQQAHLEGTKCKLN